MSKSFINIQFDEELLQQIDDFRFKFRFTSRTEAIRWLIRFALEQKPKPKTS